MWTPGRTIGSRTSRSSTASARRSDRQASVFYQLGTVRVLLRYTYPDAKRQSSRYHPLSNSPLRFCTLRSFQSCIRCKCRSAKTGCNKRQYRFPHAPPVATGAAPMLTRPSITPACGCTIARGAKMPIPAMNLNKTQKSLGNLSDRAGLPDSRVTAARTIARLFLRDI